MRSGSVLPQLRAFKQEELNNKITSCDKKISELKKKEDNTSSTIVDFFKEILTTYNNKKPLLLKLVEKHPELQSKYDSIYAQGKCTTTIENGTEVLQNVFKNRTTRQSSNPTSGCISKGKEVIRLRDI